MFGVDFMIGATWFALISYAVFAVSFLILLSIAVKLYRLFTSDEDEVHISIKKECIAIFLIVTVGLFFGSSIQPKISIDVPPNRNLIIYQEDISDIVITTPPPRTEKLDGFEP